MVPGQGDLLGVWRYGETTYAFRRGTAPNAPRILVFASSATGWDELSLGMRMHFRSASGAPEVGAILTATNRQGQSATVQRVVRTSGDYSNGDAAGFMLVDSDVGNFDTGDMLIWTNMAAATMQVASSVELQSITWADHASFDFDNGTLRGTAGGERMYAASATDYAWEFDGTLWTPLITGATNDTPAFVTLHQKHVFLGYLAGSVVHSALGEAVNFEALEGAAEIAALGEGLTGFQSGFRNSLFIYGNNKTAVLTGTSAADWTVDDFDDEAGAMANTIQLLNEPTVYDDRGIRGMEATEAYGNFTVATMSGQIRPILDRKRASGALPSASCIVRAKSQYRLFFDDGDVIVLGLNMGRTGKVYPNYSITRFEIQVAGQTEIGVVTHVASVEDDDGREVIFFTMQDSGYVYQMERGINFDGEALPAIMQLPFNDFGQPAVQKKFRRIIIEANTEDVSRFRVAADFQDGKQEGVRPTADFEIASRGGRWSEVNWSNFRWSGMPEALAELRVKGRGRNIAPLIYSRGDDIPPYTITGCTVLYDDLKLQR